MQIPSLHLDALRLAGLGNVDRHGPRTGGEDTGGVRRGVDSLELSTLAKHAYVLAQAFNSFYHRYPVVQESNEAVRTTRTAIVRVYHDGMVALLELMGIEVPQRM